MKLLTKPILDKLLRNGRERLACQKAGKHEPDLPPVVKLFTPDAQCTWLLSEVDPEDPDIAFGLCDLGMGCPELGSVRISELASVRGPLGLSVERDRAFDARHPLSVYAQAARDAGYIVEITNALDAASKGGA